MPSEAQTFPEIRDFWQQKLFEAGFPRWFIQDSLSKSFNWTAIVTSLFGNIFIAKLDGTTIPKQVIDDILRRLTVFAFTETTDLRLRDELRLSLQLDGFEVAAEDLRNMEGFASVGEEKSRLLASLKKLPLGRQEVIAKHLTDAEEHFSQGKHHSAIGEARAALQAVIEETAALSERKAQRKSGGGTKNQLEFLTQESILSDDEQRAFEAAWGFLCSGNHPGLSSEEEGRIGTILCLEFVQILLAKCKNLL